MTTIYLISGIIILNIISVWFAYNVGKSRGSADEIKKLQAHELKVKQAIENVMVNPTTVDDAIDSLHRHDF